MLEQRTGIGLELIPLLRCEGKLDDVATQLLEGVLMVQLLLRQVFKECSDPWAGCRLCGPGIERLAILFQPYCDFDDLIPGQKCHE